MDPQTAAAGGGEFTGTSQRDSSRNQPDQPKGGHGAESIAKQPGAANDVFIVHRDICIQLTQNQNMYMNLEIQLN